MKTPTELEGTEGGAVASNDVLGWTKISDRLPTESDAIEGQVMVFRPDLRPSLCFYRWDHNALVVHPHWSWHVPPPTPEEIMPRGPGIHIAVCA